MRFYYELTSLKNEEWITHLTVWQLGLPDLLRTLYESYLSWVWRLNPPQFWFPLRLVMLFLIAGVVCRLTFVTLGWRVMAVQWALFLSAGLFAFHLPIHRLELPLLLKAWFFAFSCFGLLVLPWHVSWFLARKTGWRRRVALAFYGFIAVLFMINLWRTRP